MTALTIRDTSTLEELASFPLHDFISTKQAVKKKRVAFRTSGWRTDARMRQSVLLAWADALEQHSSELIELLMGESGKVRSECIREVANSVDDLRFNAGMSRMVGGSSHELSDGPARYVIGEAAGPAAFIVPWNWPLFLLFRDLAPAMSAGVTAVMKPAPQAPLATTRALELFPQEAPHDIVQILYGDAEVGEAMANDERIYVLAFSGSTSVGHQVAASAASHFTRLVLELGGKGASVFYDDADIDTAVTASVQNASISSGQVCMASTRIPIRWSRH